MRRDGIAHPGAQTGGKARNRGGMRRSMAGRRAVRMGMLSGAACAMPESMRAEADGKHTCTVYKKRKRWYNGTVDSRLGLPIPSVELWKMRPAMKVGDGMDVGRSPAWTAGAVRCIAVKPRRQAHAASRLGVGEYPGRTPLGTAIFRAGQTQGHRRSTRRRRTYGRLSASAPMCRTPKTSCPMPGRPSGRRLPEPDGSRIGWMETSGCFHRTRCLWLQNRGLDEKPCRLFQISA